MAKKIEAATFAALFILALALPALTTNLKQNQRSDIDNSMLNDLPGLSAAVKEASARKTWGELTEAIERGLKDRVGFRAQMLSSYMHINKALFGVLAHPTYLEGREGHLYYNNESYINGYRNIYDEERLDEAAQYLAQIKSFCEARDVGFFFFLPPDKKTVYPEYFPEYIHKTDNPPLIEAFLGRLDAAGVEYACPLEAFLALKSSSKLYNKQFDIVHWNADGALEGVSLLLEKIHAEHPKALPLNRENFERATVKGERLAWSNFNVNEDVPLYTVKDGSTAINAALSNEAENASGDECAVYDNAGLEDGLTALIFRDSYLGVDNLKSEQYRLFLATSFKRTVFVHSRNLYRLSWYFNLFLPDIVIFEKVERNLDHDTGAFDKANMLATFFPRASSERLALDDSVVVLLEDIDITMRTHLTSISGKLAIEGGAAKGGAVTQVYARVGEREFPAQVDAAGRFSLTIANAALEGAGGIALTPANGGFRFQPPAASYQLPAFGQSR